MSVLLLNSCTGLREIKQKLHGGKIGGESGGKTAPVVSYVEDNTEKPDFEYILSDDESYYILKKYNGKDINVTVPAEYEDVPVKEIFADAFDGSLDLNSVGIVSGIEKIGEYAFYGCENLTDAVFPVSV